MGEPRTWTLFPGGYIFGAPIKHGEAVEVVERVVSDEMVERACAAFDGEKWRDYNASLVWPMRYALEAVLTGHGSDGRGVGDDRDPEPSTETRSATFFHAVCAGCGEQADLDGGEYGLTPEKAVEVVLDESDWRRVDGRLLCDVCAEAALSGGGDDGD